MGLNFQTRVQGHKEFRKAVRKLADKELTAELKELHRDTADIVVHPARADAPRKSGALIKSTKPSASVKAAIVKSGTAKAVPYAGPIHFGWPRRGIKATFFIFKAAFEKRDEYTALFADRVTALVRKRIESK